jgi:hypothetical protein
MPLASSREALEGQFETQALVNAIDSRCGALVPQQRAIWLDEMA